MNFQLFKLILEKAEEPEIKLPTSAAAAAAKLLQLCLTLCNPIDGSPPVDECNCALFEHSLALLFFGIGMKTDLFQSCGHC